MESPFPIERLRILHERTAQRLADSPYLEALELVVGLERLLEPWLAGDAQARTPTLGAALARAVSMLMPQAIDREYRRQVAYHEAAHVVAFLAFGFDFDRVTVDPNPAISANAVGYVLGPPLPDGEAVNDRERIQVERQVVAELVAPIAEELAGYVSDPASVERHAAAAERFLLRLTPTLSPAELGALRTYLRERAKRYAREWWPRIEQVAAALHRDGTLTRAQVIAITRRGTGDEAAA